MSRRTLSLWVAAFAASICATVPLSAETAYSGAESLFERSIFLELKTTGKIVRTSEGQPALLPRHQSAAAISSAIAAQSPDLLVEALFFLPGAAPGAAGAREAELASIYGLMRSISTLEGIEYYSASRKTMRTFYAESYVISSPESRAILPDPTPPKPGALPPSESLFAFQRDLSFGANVYRYEYSTGRDAITLTSVNLTRMSYGIVPVLPKEALATRVLIVRASDGIVFYAASGADAPGIFRDKLNDSFGNRAEALFGWFSRRYKAVVAQPAGR